MIRCTSSSHLPSSSPHSISSLLANLNRALQAIHFPRNPGPTNASCIPRWGRRAPHIPSIEGVATEIIDWIRQNQWGSEVSTVKDTVQTLLQSNDVTDDIKTRCIHALWEAMVAPSHPEIPQAVHPVLLGLLSCRSDAVRQCIVNQIQTHEQSLTNDAKTDWRLQWGAPHHGVSPEYLDLLHGWFHDDPTQQATMVQSWVNAAVSSHYPTHHSNCIRAITHLVCHPVTPPNGSADDQPTVDQQVDHGLVMQTVTTIQKAILTGLPDSTHSVSRATMWMRILNTLMASPHIGVESKQWLLEKGVDPVVFTVLIDPKQTMPLWECLDTCPDLAPSFFVTALQQADSPWQRVVCQDLLSRTKQTREKASHYFRVALGHPGLPLPIKHGLITQSIDQCRQLFPLDGWNDDTRIVILAHIGYLLGIQDERVDHGSIRSVWQQDSGKAIQVILSLIGEISTNGYYTSTKQGAVKQLTLIAAVLTDAQDNLPLQTQQLECMLEEMGKMDPSLCICQSLPDPFFDIATRVYTQSNPDTKDRTGLLLIDFLRRHSNRGRLSEKATEFKRQLLTEWLCRGDEHGNRIRQQLIRDTLNNHRSPDIRLLIGALGVSSSDSGMSVESKQSILVQMIESHHPLCREAIERTQTSLQPDECTGLMDRLGHHWRKACASGHVVPHIRMLATLFQHTDYQRWLQLPGEEGQNWQSFLLTTIQRLRSHGHQSPSAYEVYLQTLSTLLTDENTPLEIKKGLLQTMMTYDDEPINRVFKAGVDALCHTNTPETHAVVDDLGAHWMSIFTTPHHRSRSIMALHPYWIEKKGADWTLAESPLGDTYRHLMMAYMNYYSTVPSIRDTYLGWLKEAANRLSTPHKVTLFGHIVNTASRHPHEPPVLFNEILLEGIHSWCRTIRQNAQQANTTQVEANQAELTQETARLENAIQAVAGHIVTHIQHHYSGTPAPVYFYHPFLTGPTPSTSYLQEWARRHDAWGKTWRQHIVRHAPHDILTPIVETTLQDPAVPTDVKDDLLVLLIETNQSPRLSQHTLKQLDQATLEQWVRGAFPDPSMEISPRLHTLLGKALPTMSYPIRIDDHTADMLIDQLVGTDLITLSPLLNLTPPLEDSDSTHSHVANLRVLFYQAGVRVFIHDQIQAVRKNSGGYTEFRPYPHFKIEELITLSTLQSALVKRLLAIKANAASFDATRQGSLLRLLQGQPDSTPPN